MLSPNTPGLRGLQNKAELETLLTALAEARAKLARRVPLLLKSRPGPREQARAHIGCGARQRHRPAS